MTTPTTKSATTLKLNYPIEYQGATISELKVRRPKGRDMRFLPSGDNVSVEGMFPFFALLSGVDEQVIDEIDAADLNALGQLVNDFLSQNKPAKRR